VQNTKKNAENTPRLAESSDVALLDMLRRVDGLTVPQLSEAMGVTATAVRQRLTRLMGQGLIERQVRREEPSRGRPSHEYSLTEQGRRKTGANFADLSIALWREIRNIKDPDVRRGLLERLAKTLAEMYGDQVDGESIEERMQAVKALFAQRGVSFAVESENQLPVLTAVTCPYPDLAEQDRSICALEKMLLSELLNENVHLTGCRLDGESCCTFEAQ